MKPNFRNSAKLKSAANNPYAARAQALFNEGLALHQKGRLAEAKVIYEKLLKIQPQHFDALHLLGVVAIQTKNHSIAVQLIDKAIAINPIHAAAYNNCGNALQELKRSDEALARYDQAIKLKSDFADAYYNRGNPLQELKRFDEALASYDQAIKLKSDFSDAYYNRGNLLQALKRFDEALQSYDQTIKLKADFAEAYYNRSIALQALKRFDEALASCDQAIKLKADYAEAHTNRGNALQALKRFDEAVKSYDQAIKLKADYAGNYSNRGNALQALRRFDEALASCDQAIKLKADYAEAYNNRGITLHAVKRFDEALASYEQAIKFKADYAEAYSNRGNSLQSLRRFDEALESCKQAINLKADFAEAYMNRGNALQALKRFAEALKSYDQAIKFKADYAEAYSSRGNALQELKPSDEVLARYEQATKLKADYAEAHLNLSLRHLLMGDFIRGWEGYEWRWEGGELAKSKRNFPQPLWLGKVSLQGKTILLHSEQFLGDTLQFCRYARLVADLGASVILEVEKPLLGLLGQLDGAIQLVAKGDVLPPFDYQCPLLSLPLAFKTDLNTIPTSQSYLAASPSKVEEWKAKLGERTKPRAGLVWSGSTTHKNDRNRSIVLGDIIRCLPQQFQYVSLQKDVRDADKGMLDSRTDIFNFSAQLTDFSDTAALCELMDVVISVDTSVAHLSGALGKPTWVLLPLVPDWRWLLDGETSPWYPSAKLFRQDKQGDWDGVLDRVRTELMRLVNTPA